MSVSKLNNRYLTAEQREIHHQRENYYHERHLFYIITQLHCMELYRIMIPCEKCLINKVCKKYNPNNLSKFEIIEYALTIYINKYGGEKIFDELL